MPCKRGWGATCRQTDVTHSSRMQLPLSDCSLWGNRMHSMYSCMHDSYIFGVSDRLMRMMQHCSNSLTGSCLIHCLKHEARTVTFIWKIQLLTATAFDFECVPTLSWSWPPSDHWFHLFNCQLHYLALLDTRHYMATYAQLLRQMKSLHYKTDDVSVGCLGQWSNLIRHMESNREDTMARMWIRKIHSDVSIYVIYVKHRSQTQKCVITKKWWQDPD